MFITDGKLSMDDRHEFGKVIKCCKVAQFTVLHQYTAG